MKASGLSASFVCKRKETNKFFLKKFFEKQKSERFP